MFAEFRGGAVRPPLNMCLVITILLHSSYLKIKRSKQFNSTAIDTADEGHLQLSLTVPINTVYMTS